MLRSIPDVLFYTPTDVKCGKATGRIMVIIKEDGFEFRENTWQ
jgi:hypothetical protein